MREGGHIHFTSPGPSKPGGVKSLWLSKRVQDRGTVRLSLSNTGYNQKVTILLTSNLKVANGNFIFISVKKVHVLLDDLKDLVSYNGRLYKSLWLSGEVGKSPLV